VNKTLVLLVLSMGVPVSAETYSVAAGASAATIQNLVNQAGSAPGNTVSFAAGSYNLSDTVLLPCSNGTVYTGPNVGVVSQTNLPRVLLSSTNSNNYAMSINSNGSSFTGAQGCTIQYLRFSGTQGGVFVNYPASGIVIQQNAFDNNDPPAGGYASQANIYVDGANWQFTPDAGVSHITMVWNTFFNNCATIRSVAWPDSGGGCAATWVNGYNNYLTWSNNTVNLTEEGLKLSLATADGIASLNADVENNNMQGNSRILIETQQDTNGVGTYSHNAFYQPYNPSFNTFELSIPEWSTSVSPTHTVSDNVFLGNVPITIGGAGGHYGIGLELWGAGSIATNNLFQGGNGPDDCSSGWGCSGWGITVGEPYTNAVITGNYFSGTDVWGGSATDVSAAVTYEDDGSSSNPGIVLWPNTVVQTSTTQPITAPVISVTSVAGTATVALREPVAAHSVTIFYTTDGSTPAIFGPGQSAGTTRVYSAPFAMAGGTVKAVASWGQGANQGIRFPSFGYVPSAVVSQAVSGASAVAPPPAAVTLVSAYLGAAGGANSMVKGGTLQFSAYGVFSDGSVHALPDAQGNKVTLWNTSNHAVAKISSSGHVTALASGVVSIKAVVGGVAASPWTVNVSAVKAAVQPAATAEAAPAVAEARSAAAPSAAADAAEPASPPPAAPSAAAPAPGDPATGAGGGAAAGPVPVAPSSVLADNFQGPLWAVSAPAGGSASISGGHLFLGVPGGSNHSPLQATNQAVRVLQPIGNQDFDVAIKIDSPLYATDAGTSQGLMVVTDDKNFVTFALETDGSKVGLSAHTVQNGTPTSVLADSDFAQYQNPMYLRLSRTGSAYAAFYSTDGQNWSQAVSFTDTTAPTAVGPFAANENNTPAQAVPVVMSVNWFDVQQ
jgi:regulation of enolase protein 1 (concanavalin A-like superfamily)